VRQNATTQIGPEITLDPEGDAVGHGIRFGGLRQESLEVMLDEWG
jgi:hypothetical protein